MKRASFFALVALACAAILTAPSVRAQGYQFLQRNCPSCVVSFSSLTASTSVTTPDIKGAGGQDRILLPSAGTTTITSTAPSTGSADAHVFDTSATFNSGDVLFRVKNAGTSKFFIDNAGVVASSGGTFAATGSPATLRANVSDSGSAQTALKLVNLNALTNSSSNIWCGYSDNGTTSQLCLRKDGSLIPSVNNSATLGASNLGFASVAVGSILDVTGTTRFTVTGSASNVSRAAVADSSTTVAHEFRSKNTLSTTGARALQIDSDDGTTAQAYLIKDANGWGWRVEGKPAPVYNATGANAKAMLAGTTTLSAGAAATSFSTAFAATPVCTATDQTGTNAVQVTISASALTLHGTSTDVINWICIGDR